MGKGLEEGWLKGSRKKEVKGSRKVGKGLEGKRLEERAQGRVGNGLKEEKKGR